MRRSLALVACLVALAAWPAAAAGATPTTPPLALYGYSGEETHLSRLDALTLAPTEPRTEVPEWHNGYSFSPDGRHAAFTVSTPGAPGTPFTGRVGMRVIDLTTMEAVADFRLGVAASAIGWLTPRGIVATTQGGQIYVADPQTGQFRMTGRAAGGCIDPPGKAVTARALVFLLGNTLNVVDRDGERRHVGLRRMSEVCGRLGLAVDRARQIAYVSGVGPEVAVVNLRTLAVRYRRVGATSAHGVAYTRASPFGGYQFVAAHESSRGLPRGVDLVDLIDGDRRLLDPLAGGARVAGERVLVYDGRHPNLPGGAGRKGVRAYDLSGRRRYTLLGDAVVQNVEVLGRFAYAQLRGGGVRVIDLRERRVVGSAPFEGTLELHFVLPELAGL